MSTKEHRESFFRQSGWMMFANFATGILMAAVHTYSKVIPDAEYSVLGVMLMALNWMAVPSAGLSMSFAHQASAAATEEDRRRLRGAVHGVTRLVLFGWLAGVVVLACCSTWLARTLQLNSLIVVWTTAATGLLMLWSPVLSGVLQGRQNFLWLGISMMAGGAGRLIFAGVAVFAISASATGIMAAACLGALASLAVAAWQTRTVLSGPRAPFEVRDWVGRMVPMTIGMGAFQVMIGVDLFVVKSSFTPEEVAPYVTAGVLARALVIFTTPIATVMFPKVVQSLARSQTTDVFKWSLAGTAILACIGAIGLSTVAPLALRLMGKGSYVSIAPLLPWYAWSMVPLAVANLLLNNLLARGHYRALVPLLGVAIAYTAALYHFHDSFLSVVKTLAVFNTIFLVVAGFLTWLEAQPGQSGRPGPGPASETTPTTG